MHYRYRDGVVVGADSRTSVSGYVSNRLATKISFILENDFHISPLPPSSEMQLKSSFLETGIENIENTEKDDIGDIGDSSSSNSNIGSISSISSLSKPSTSTCCICRSGSAADTQYLADTIRHQLLRRKILHSTSTSVSEVAHLIKNYVNMDANDNLSASLICAGYDHMKDEGSIYAIDLGGTMMEQREWACNGSGSGYILGMIDDVYPKIQNGGNSDGNNDSSMMWDEEEATAFVKRAIALAMERDGSSGGVVRLFVINKEGKKAIIHVPDFNLGKRHNNNSNSSNNLSKFAPAIRTTSK
jgi:20S proteasome subunit beta 1